MGRCFEHHQSIASSIGVAVPCAREFAWLNRPPPVATIKTDERRDRFQRTFGCERSLIKRAVVADRNRQDQPATFCEHIRKDMINGGQSPFRFVFCIMLINPNMLERRKAKCEVEFGVWNKVENVLVDYTITWLIFVYDRARKQGAYTVVLSLIHI